LDPEPRPDRGLGNDREIGRATANDSRLKHGADLLARNKPETAEATFREVIESFPQSAAAHALLAMALADQARSREAVHAADQAVSLNPHLALSHAARACALEASGLVWEAEMESRQAVALAPTDPNRHSDLAGIVGRAGRFGEALDITGRGLSLNPQHLPSLHCRAMALVSLGRVDEAQDLLTSALLEDPDLAQLHASIGLMLEDRGDTVRAADEFREAVRLDNSVMAAHDGLHRISSSNSRLRPGNWRRKG
jgi:tetratricopeptide (TPR) repeat protein